MISFGGETLSNFTKATIMRKCCLSASLLGKNLKNTAMPWFYLLPFILHVPTRCVRQFCRLDLPPQEEAEDRDSRRGAVQHQWLSGGEFGTICHLLIEV